MANAATADLSGLATDLHKASGESMMMSAQKVLQDAAVKIQSSAQSKAPVKSGRLKNSIGIRNVGPLRVIVGPTVPYAPYMEFGTGTRGEFPGAAYTIRPKKPGGVLVFTVNGKKVVARVVHHPGVSARPFMRPAFEEVLGGDLLSQLAEAGMAAITRGPNA